MHDFYLKLQLRVPLDKAVSKKTHKQQLPIQQGLSMALGDLTDWIQWMIKLPLPETTTPYTTGTQPKTEFFRRAVFF